MLLSRAYASFTKYLNTELILTLTRHGQCSNLHAILMLSVLEILNYKRKKVVKYVYRIVIDYFNQMAPLRCIAEIVL